MPFPSLRQRRAYDTQCRGRAFTPGDKVWMYCPVCKQGVSPKLQSHWQGPGEVVNRLWFSRYTCLARDVWWCCTKTDSHPIALLPNPLSGTTDPSGGDDVVTGGVPIADGERWWHKDSWERILKCSWDCCLPDMFCFGALCSCSEC